MNPTRRDFMKTALAGMAVAVQGQGRNLTLLKGGRVLSLDSSVGDFDKADVLIDGSKIANVQPSIINSAARVIDASNMIVMPGFIDTHRHAWEAPLRNILPDGLLSDYTRDITGKARAIYRP